MAILAFQKPDKVLMLEADNAFGRFEFRPLEPGYGVTVGNALRRILLSGLEGFAICSIRIDGVQHEFATIPGVKEDVTNIILNLKKVRLKRIVEDTDTEKAVVKVSGQSVFKAGDIGKVLSAFEVLNPELEICHLDPSTSGFQLELSINKGRGYVPAEENKNANDPIDVIPIDSIYTPILNVKTAVENFRVEQKTDYEKLIIEITTDGSIHPKDALKGAAEILIQHFQLFTDREIVLDNTENNANEEFDEEVLKMRQMLKTKLMMLKQQENEEKKSGIRGEVKENAWGSQIRSYVLQPYKMVKDLRTGAETSNTDSVLDGDLDMFINAYLKWTSLGAEAAGE